MTPHTAEEALAAAHAASTPQPPDTHHMVADWRTDLERATDQLAALRATGWDVVSRLNYEARVTQMADALHQDCILEWQAIGVVDPGRMVTQHMADAHYGKAHDLVRRIWPEGADDAR